MSESKIDWKAEGDGVIKDISSNVIHFSISDQLQITSPEEGVYLNLETLEGNKFTVKLNSSGFTLVGEKFDDTTLEEGQGATSFETVYALLQSTSPQYVSSFAGSLHKKLAALARLPEQKERNTVWPVED